MESFGFCTEGSASVTFSIANWHTRLAAFHAALIPGFTNNAYQDNLDAATLPFSRRYEVMVWRLAFF
jgi:hypothetical protein